ncbi:CheY-like chemotaxis protein [Rhodanobacter sp. ANJX3]|jgi:CheY-like chemotaxis protein|uniref:response regulator n=1 Tax=unclassified Rhodanobacter TaxID=2621553 RepID=UPI0015CC6EB0|nr:MULTISPECIES: response regulator [unclassified Rhodanobacter]MBB5357300.1 CheY-like chemotaxis protein [Rhodanobacter sp. ANJX3]NYE27354.1 CheY-like chemotaxis protein [Rhodanobacter sp. K2T2]
MDTDKVVLIVDDDHAVLETMRILLEGRGGFRVKCVVGSSGASHFLSTQDRVDVLIADVLLAGEINGIDVCNLARLQHPDVGLVVISADPNTDERQLPERIVYLRKPFGGKELVEAIERVQAFATLGLTEIRPKADSDSTIEPDSTTSL